MAGFGLNLAIGFLAGFDPAGGFQSWKIMMLCQALGGNHGAGPRLFPAMSRLFLAGHRMTGRDLAEARPGIGQDLTRLAFSARHQSPPPALIAATVRRLQCRASAVTTLIKRQFGHVKTRYRGLARNRAQLFTMFALGNLFRVRKRLMA